MQAVYKIQQQKNGQFQVTLPPAIVRMKGWQKGTLLEWKEDGKGNLVLKKGESSG